MNSAERVNICIGVLALSAIFFLIAYGPDVDTGASVQQTVFAERALSPENTVDAEALAVPAEPPPGYVQYKNERYGFSYYHSPEAVIKEYDEGGGAMTITQENSKKVRGMQIFIVPYSESTISEERFKRDVPSGIRKNVEKTFIGVPQVEAVTFNSYDTFLGETREVWFIHKGYLYEVTTFKGVGDWFTPIMQTWRFI